MINMDIPSAVLKERAKATLRGTYWTFVGATLIVAIVSALISGIAQLLGPAVGAVATIAVALFYTIPVSLGVQRMYIRTAQGCGVNTNEIFNIYKSGNLINSILVLFLKGLFTFLWSLLFVIPGIIKGYSYLLIDYMMAENPALDQSRAFEISKQLMYGNRFKAFVVELSFIGWQLLSVLTFGIGMLFLTPYMSMTMTHFYLELKERGIHAGIIRPDDNLYAVQASNYSQNGPEFN